MSDPMVDLCVYEPDNGPRDVPVRWFWRCTVCPLDARGAVASASTEYEARAQGEAHMIRRHKDHR